MKYYIYSLLKGLLFHVPILVLFLNKKFSYEEVALLISIKTILGLVLEIPSGYISDRIGHTNTIKISFFFNIISLVLIYKGDNFALIMMGQVVFSIAESLESGTWFAWLNARKEEANNFLSNNRVAFSWSLLASFSLGGYLYTLNPEFPFILSLIALVILTLAFTLIESNSPMNRQSHQRQSTLTMEYFKKISSYCLPLSVTGGIIYAYYLFAFPLLFKAFFDDELLIGLCVSLGVLAFGYGSKLGDSIPKRLQYAFCSWGVLTVFIGTLTVTLVIENGYVLAIHLVGLRFLWGAADYLNQILVTEVESADLTATNVSILSALESGTAAIFIMILGYLI